MTGGREILKEISLFVLDMDGTFYLGDRRLDGALEFIHAVEAAGKKFLFFTNNSSKSPEDYIRKLEKMDCRISRDQIGHIGGCDNPLSEGMLRRKNSISDGNKGAGGKF